MFTTTTIKVCEFHGEDSSGCYAYSGTPVCSPMDQQQVSATCDNCEAGLESRDGHFEFGSAEEAVEEARRAGWSVGTIAPGRLYCPTCAARHLATDWS